MKVLTASNFDILQAADLLRQGKLVALPTETVYGLAADASNDEALHRIFLAKGRPIDHPLIVHISHINQLDDWAIDVSDIARQLAVQYWPGPLTLVLKKQAYVSDLITGKQDTVAIRMPNHPVTLSILNEFGGAVCAPSANRFGRISPTSAQDVYEELETKIDAVVDGGRCEVGIESTIIDATSNLIQILRPGMIDELTLQKAIGHIVIDTTYKKTVRISGNLAHHYSPITPCYLLSKEDLDRQDETVLQTSFILTPYTLADNQQGLIMPTHPQAYANALYHYLREADKLAVRQILVVAPPQDKQWMAIWDRLERACQWL